MNRNRITSLLVLVLVTISLVISACSHKPETFEEYMAENPEYLDEIRGNVSDGSSSQVDISGNDITFVYDMQSYEGITDEMIESEVLQKSLANALDAADDRFIEVCVKLEEKSEIENIHLIVSYVYGERVLVTRTYSKEGVVE